MGFTSEDNGYVIVAGDRAMRFEMTYVFLTNDGGKSWQQVGDTSKITNMLVNGAAFSTDKIGFISFISAGNIPYPTMKYTENKGETWQDVKLPLPKDYEGIFLRALSPKFEGASGELLVDQGENGDYGKGKVARFLTKDYGLTWVFDDIVTIDDVE
ncbi:hypothetical protein [Clostridium vincentii]|uniref:Ycf48-like protein n=1 Tax=Clostridium vincentii TaxID=52704 RepID=A0A2T0BDG5_9CLOT|nr:hypothetical protein [Clostridium vincentii]PRR81941.1 hypothetical protein CLVI_21490 [Clostridium vincentii]